MKQAVKINEKGQIIASEHQLFDTEARLIDKHSKIFQRQVSKNRDNSKKSSPLNSHRANQLNSQNTTQY